MKSKQLLPPHNKRMMATIILFKCLIWNGIDSLCLFDIIKMQDIRIAKDPFAVGLFLCKKKCPYLP